VQVPLVDLGAGLLVRGVEEGERRQREAILRHDEIEGGVSLLRLARSLGDLDDGAALSLLGRVACCR
jgi:hypothetical protein